MHQSRVMTRRATRRASHLKYTNRAPSLNLSLSCVGSSQAQQKKNTIRLFCAASCPKPNIQTPAAQFVWAVFSFGCLSKLALFTNIRHTSNICRALIGVVLTRYSPRRPGRSPGRKQMLSCYYSQLGPGAAHRK